MDRQAKLLGDRHQDAALRGAVELGHDEPGDAGHRRGTSRPGTSAFWPVVASSTSSTACGAVGIDLFQHAHDLLELGHQLGLVLQPPGGVDEQHVGALASRLVQRVEGEAGGIGARLGAAITGAPVRSPQILQLLDRGGAERVAGRQHHLAPSRAEACAASLPIVVVLPEPLTPTTRITKGCASRRSRSGFATGASTAAISAASTPSTSSVATSLSKRPSPIAAAIRAASLDAEIGLDQQLLELLERRLVELSVE